MKFIRYESSLNQTIPFPAPKDLLGCTFEGNTICRWTQSVNDKFNWTLHKGSTSTTDSGPSTDHTTGNSTYLFKPASVNFVSFMNLQKAHFIFYFNLLDTWLNDWLALFFLREHLSKHILISHYRNWYLPLHWSFLSTKWRWQCAPGVAYDAIRQDEWQITLLHFLVPHVRPSRQRPQCVETDGR